MQPAESGTTCLVHWLELETGGQLGEHAMDVFDIGAILVVVAMIGAAIIQQLVRGVAPGTSRSHVRNSIQCSYCNTEMNNIWRGTHNDLTIQGQRKRVPPSNVSVDLNIIDPWREGSSSKFTFGDHEGLYARTYGLYQCPKCLGEWIDMDWGEGSPRRLLPRSRQWWICRSCCCAYFVRSDRDLRGFVSATCSCGAEVRPPS